MTLLLEWLISQIMKQLQNLRYIAEIKRLAQVVISYYVITEKLVT